MVQNKKGIWHKIKASPRELDSGRYLEYKHFDKENDGISEYSKKESKAREIGNTSYKLW